MKGTGAWLKEGMDPATSLGKPFEQLEGFVATGTGSSSDSDLPSEPPAPPLAAKFDTKAMDPMPGEVESFIGVVRAKSSGTAKLAAIYQGLGDLGQKVLGLPPPSKAVQLTIERNDDDPVESFTCIASQSITNGIHIGQMVWATIEAREASDKAVWLVTDLNAF